MQETGERGPGLWTVIGVVLLVAVARLAFAGLLPLTEDEAYYRLWSMELQAGYHDHPPMIAWWIAAGRTLAGDNALGVRLLPVLAQVAVAALLVSTLRTLGAGPRPALRAGLWLNAALLVGIGGLLAIPDAPTTLFWTLTLWAIARAIHPAATPARALGWWAVAGVAAGLAVLSKYSALFLAPGLLLWLCLTPENRRRLLTPGPWLAAILAAAVTAPHLVWNATNGWASVLKQFGRVEPRAFSFWGLPELLAGQFVLLNPIIAVFLVTAIFARRKGAPLAATALLWVTAVPFLAYLAVHALHDPVQAHWPAPVYPALIGLAALAAERAGEGSRPGRRWRRAAPVVGLGLAGLILMLAVTPALDPVTGPAMRPLRGWPLFAEAVQARAVAPIAMKAADETPRGERRGDAPTAAWIGTASYGLAAQLQAESALELPVVQLNDRARYATLPATVPPDFARPGLVVDLPRRVSAEALGACFAKVQALAPIHRPVADSPARAVTYAVYRVEQPRRLVAGGCRLGRDLTTP
ncbi:glycosyltransferase family 39 protein [Brevundimonas sp. GCM10030266]|uniref:glycosyltransferase family 39 protein n=1 Tax=Brevundimonas sp. GCM10030266 TaxID=3273386 RepID=UPI003623C1F6